MIGLEYIMKMNNTTFNFVEELLNIKRQNAQSWCSKDLLILSQEFEIPIEYFQKELNEVDKLKLQKIKLLNECDKLGLKLEEI